jgi:hypothetical protein
MPKLFYGGDTAFSGIFDEVYNNKYSLKVFIAA